jgi:protein-disulfide isomerase
VLAVLAATGVFSGIGPGNVAEPLTQRQQDDLVAGAHQKGDADAPVTVLEFGDFQCPFCRQFREGTLAAIEADYLEGGQVRIAYHHKAFLGSESLLAAEASECAADQGAFFAYHDLLYANQGAENQGHLTTDLLRTFAQDLGLDGAVFATCLLDREHQATVQAANARADSVGARSTPTVLINGVRVANPLDTAAVRATIEAALAGSN